MEKEDGEVPAVLKTRFERYSVLMVSFTEVERSVVGAKGLGQGSGELVLTGQGVSVGEN